MLNYNKLHTVLFCRAKAWVIIIGVMAIPEVLRADLDVFMGCKCWSNTGTPGVWERKIAWDIGPYPDSVYVHSSFCDLDNDGDYDAYVTGDASLITAFENIGCDTTPIWQKKSEWNFYPQGMEENKVYWCVFVDLNNDSKLDLIVSKHNSGRVYKNTGDTLFEWTRQPLWDISVPWENNVAPSFADLDGDGDYDVIVYIWHNQTHGQIPARVFENAGSAISPIWQEKPSWNPPSYMGLLSLGDLDGDCDMDILGGGSFQSSALENTGTITNPVWTERSGWCTPDANNPIYPELIDIDTDGPSGVEEKHFASHQGFITIYPNPFTQKTVIEFTVHSSQFTDKNCQPSTVNCQLQIHDLAGRLVKSFPIHDSRFAIHKVTWDGTDDNGKKVKSGIYFCKFQANNYAATKKISLIK